MLVSFFAKGGGVGGVGMGFFSNANKFLFWLGYSLPVTMDLNW